MSGRGHGAAPVRSRRRLVIVLASFVLGPRAREASACVDDVAAPCANAKPRNMDGEFSAAPHWRPTGLQTLIGFVVKSLPLDALKWLVVAVVLITAAQMLRSATRG